MPNKTISILNILEDTTVDGPGFRTAIYSAGCEHKCPSCHNPESWDINNGKMENIETIAEKVLSDEFANVTFTGGDPMFQTEAFAELAKIIKERSSKNIWCYTGFLYEALLKREDCMKLLSYIDILVDGPFILSLKTEEVPFRGSSNQRLIDVQASLQNGETVLWGYEPRPVL